MPNIRSFNDYNQVSAREVLMGSAYYSKFESDCCLCSEIKIGVFPEEYASVYGVDNRICLESDNFIVIPSVSPITAGHTMLLPKHHYTCMMACPIEMKAEALTLIDSLYTKLTARFGQLFLFEHGVGRLDDVACGINHAHLHFVPLAKNIATEVTEKINNEIKVECWGTYDELLSAQPNEKAYLMFGSEIDQMFLATNYTIPSQIVRKVISSVLNLPNWNWRLKFGRDDFLNTIKFLETA